MSKRLLHRIRPNGTRRNDIVGLVAGREGAEDAKKKTFRRVGIAHRYLLIKFVLVGSAHPTFSCYAQNDRNKNN